ncbi:MAG: hypothetical protein J6A23_13485 [Thermoguttaceae bacterium]|nr:hypothetical protein [Thermoguttaceae bacterium]
MAANPNHFRRHNEYAQNRYSQSSRSGKSSPESADKIGSKFHNPYTFIPFSDKPSRFEPTLYTADEVEKERHSGVLDIEIKTLRPLLTSQAEPRRKGEDPPKNSVALKIGRDVIVPATAIRGALRNLMTILTSGSLANTNPNSWFCRGRDVNLGNGTGKYDTPCTLFLAKVERAGNTFQDGVIRIGKCMLLANGKSPAEKTKWELKPAGRSPNPRTKRAFYAVDPDQYPITVPAELWADYIARNINGKNTELRTNDLVWVEPKFLNIGKIVDANQIASLQWARWGKRGIKLDNVLPDTSYLPNSCQKDGKVDFVTNLFGQASDSGDKNVPCFAGRIRPENLVFRDTVPKLWKQCPLAAMASPHPGCFSFYFKAGKQELRGFKVYRSAQDGDSPWEYKTQPIFNNNGSPTLWEKSKQTHSADLLPSEQTGRLRIAFHALTSDELALLCHACSLKYWRLGGGKPLGLGLCQPTLKSVTILEDDGSFRKAEPEDFPLGENLSELVGKQAKIWEATQKPVSKMRYPRAAKKNSDSKQRGGHVWFGTFSAPKKNNSAFNEVQSVYVTERFRNSNKLSSSQIKGQHLPEFDQNDPEADVLYGYDVDLNPKKEGHTLYYDDFKPFKTENQLPADTRHAHPNDSQNRESRMANKEKRKEY